MNECELIKKCQHGDMKAFALLYEQHHEKVLNICWRFVNDRHIAEDLCQEIFIKVFRNLDQFRFQSSFTTWIHRISMNHTLNYCRKYKYQQQPIEKTFDPNLLDNLHADGSNSPDIMLEQEEQSKIIWQAVCTLPEAQKTVLILQKYEGYSIKEIADILNCTSASVESRLHRAKIKLSKKLSSFYKKNA
ncbi:RNA polymerase sigma factor [bacterium]|nr:RNA polymerase sigma factor [bacterium]